MNGTYRNVPVHLKDWWSVGWGCIRRWNVAIRPKVGPIALHCFQRCARKHMGQDGCTTISMIT